MNAGTIVWFLVAHEQVVSLNADTRSVTAHLAALSQNAVLVVEWYDFEPVSPERISAVRI